MISRDTSKNCFPAPENHFLNSLTIQIANVQRREKYYRFAKHIHSKLEMYLITEGCCQMDVATQNIRCCEGDFILILPNIPHSFYLTTQEPCVFQHIHFFPDLLSCFILKQQGDFSVDLISALGTSPAYYKAFYHMPADPDILALFPRIISENESADMFGRTYANLDLLRLLIHIVELRNIDFSSHASQNSAQNEYINFALKYISEHYDTKMHVEDIAKELNVSSRYLRKVFMEQMHTNPLNCLHNYRINKALQLMIHTDMSLTEISAAIGLSDSQHFSRLFRDTIGSPPSQYRKLLLATNEE